MSHYIIGVFGRKGSGKTELVKKVLPKIHRYIVIDTLAEYEGVVFCSLSELYAFLREHYKNNFKIAFRPGTDEDIDKFFVLSAQINNYTLICEEVDYYATPISINQDLLNNIKYGRHYMRNLIYISRRPAEVSRFLTSQSDMMITFEQHEPRDMDHLKKYRWNKEIQTLEKYDYAVTGNMDYLAFFS